MILKISKTMLSSIVTMHTISLCVVTGSTERYPEWSMTERCKVRILNDNIKIKQQMKCTIRRFRSCHKPFKVYLNSEDLFTNQGSHPGPLCDLLQEVWDLAQIHKPAFPTISNFECGWEFFASFYKKSRARDKKVTIDNVEFHKDEESDPCDYPTLNRVIEGILYRRAREREAAVVNWSPPQGPPRTGKTFSNLNPKAPVWIQKNDTCRGREYLNRTTDATLGTTERTPQNVDTIRCGGIEVERGREKLIASKSLEPTALEAIIHKQDTTATKTELPTREAIPSEEESTAKISPFRWGSGEWDEMDFDEEPTFL